MRKILLISLLFTTIFFPGSDVFAADKCSKTTASICSDGSKPNPGCPGSGGAPGLPIQKPVWTCPSGTGPSTQDDTCECRTGLPNAATTGTSTTTTTTTPQCTSPTDPNCTGGRGQMCWIAPGSADNGKAVPAGTIPAAGTKTGILTAIGCIPTEPQALVEGLLKYGTFASAAIAFLLMILGALQMITAEGNPESVKHGQERFYSAIIGLLLIIFSVLLLQVIGVDVLGLKGFGA